MRSKYWYTVSMEIFDLLLGIVNGIVGILNGLLNLVEQIVSPVVNLVQRWNNIFGAEG
jgi:hypothetical protein